MFEFLFEFIAEILFEDVVHGTFEFVSNKFSVWFSNLFAFATVSAVKPTKKLTFSKSPFKKQYSTSNQENFIK